MKLVEIPHNFALLSSQMGITRSPLPHHQGTLPLPLFGGKCLVILHDLLDKITIKPVRSLPFYPQYGKFSRFFLYITTLYISDVFSIFIFLPKITEQCIKTCNILQFLEQKLLQKRLFLIFRIVFNNIQRGFCTLFSSKCIVLYVLISEQFNDISSLKNMTFNMFILNFYQQFGHFGGHINRHNNNFLVV